MNALKNDFAVYVKFYLAAAVVLFTAQLSCLTAAETNEVSVWREGPSDQWFVEWDKALAQAKKTKKNIFVLNTGSDWCHWCKKLREDVLDTQEFKKFAGKNLVLLYLDNPSRLPLGKDQKMHNRQVVKALEFGGGVPSATVVSPNGAKFGIVSGGGGTAKSYIERIKKTLRNGRTPYKDRNTMILFKKGYGVFAEKIAAERAKLPPVAHTDFSARLTGVAIVDRKMRNRPNSAVFLPPETKLKVPFGKTVLFRVEYDFPKGYTARVWVRAGERGLSRYFGSNPSGLYGGKGTAYGFLSLLDRGKACVVKSVDLRTNSDPELDEFPYGWSMTNAVVDVHFLR